MIRLCTSEYCFEIDTANARWCQCWLTKGENAIYLGAESLLYLKEHLLSGLDDNPKESMGRLEDMSVSWILSLAEAHYVLYVSMNTEDKTLIWQNAQSAGKETYIMTMSRDQLLQWRTQLKAFQ